MEIKENSLENKLYKYVNTSRKSIGNIRDDSKDNILKEEKLKIYKEICQCYSQCLKFEDSDYKLSKEANICNKITINDNYNDNTNLSNLINKTISFLIKNNYIKAIGDIDNHKYYITVNGTTVKLNWENIKNLKDKNKPEGELFWLVRKLIVDSLLKIIINEHRKNETYITIANGDQLLISKDEFNDVKIYSVGSTDITSDYDITLYSNNNYIIGIIIEEFQNKFMKIFGEHSSIVFDTNIYGKAYIIFDCNKHCEINYLPIDSSKCSNQKESFYYIKSLNNNKGLIDGISGQYKCNQVIWGLIKYLRDLRDSFGENIYNKYFNFIQKNVNNNNILDITQETLIYLRNTNITYIDLIENEDTHRKDYKLNNFSSLLFTNDYISLINFYGEETYFTRGAFLDTVVNSQMCKGSEPVIELYKEDYIASILENAGFFFLHNDKTKYLKRVKNSLILLIKNNKEYEYLLKSIYVHDLFNVTSDNYDYCNWIDNDDFNLLKCEKYDMFQVVFKIIYRLLKTYLSDIEFVNFPFYTIYIKEHLAQLRSPKNIDFTPDFIFDNSRKSSFDTSRRNSYFENIPPVVSLDIPSINLPKKEQNNQPKLRSRGHTIVSRPQTVYNHIYTDTDTVTVNLPKHNSLSNLNKSKSKERL